VALAGRTWPVCRSPRESVGEDWLRNLFTLSPEEAGPSGTRRSVLPGLPRCSRVFAGKRSRHGGGKLTMRLLVPVTSLATLPHLVCALFFGSRKETGTNAIRALPIERLRSANQARAESGESAPDFQDKAPAEEDGGRRCSSSRRHGPPGSVQPAPRSWPDDRHGDHIRRAGRIGALPGHSEAHRPARRVSPIILWPPLSSPGWACVKRPGPALIVVGSTLLRLAIISASSSSRGRATAVGSSAQGACLSPFLHPHQRSPRRVKNQWFPYWPSA
jgi:hypothetical protein